MCLMDTRRRCTPVEGGFEGGATVSHRALAVCEENFTNSWIFSGGSGK